MNYKIKVNGQVREVDVDADTPLLWVLRDSLGLCGTKYGCGVSTCGACTVHIDGKATHSCSTLIGEVKDKAITTIEGLSKNGDHPLQKAWVELDVPQCGFCQAGQIMTAAALLAENKNPSDQDIDDAMEAALCRCGTYDRIRSAIKQAAKGGK